MHVKKGDLNIKQTIGPLHSIVNPEEKRKIIGDSFVKVRRDYFTGFQEYFNKAFRTKLLRISKTGLDLE